MRKFVLAIAAIASMTATGAFAEGYVGIGVGPTRADFDCTGTTSCDNSSTGGKVFGGYKFTKALAAEVTYSDFGKDSASAVISGTTYDITLKGTSLGLGVAYFVDFAPKWSGVGRLGIASTRTKVTVASGAPIATDSETNSSAYAGVGVSYEISKGLKLDGALDFSRVEYAGESADVRMLSLGLSYAF